jgi:hypothetical protein
MAREGERVDWGAARSPPAGVVVDAADLRVRVSGFGGWGVHGRRT